MKKNLLLSVIAMAFLLLFCNAFGQTTQEEFNFITKGYKVQIESGLDMKKGYSFVEYGDWGLNKGTERRSCTFSGLVRLGESKPCAILLQYQRTDIENGANYYICIPSANSSEDIWNQTLDFISLNFNTQPAAQQAVIWGLMKFASLQAAK